MTKNKRFGFTHGVLLLPIKLSCDSADSLSRKDIRTTLENKRMSDIVKWRKDNLMPSQMKCRKKRADAYSIEELRHQKSGTFLRIKKTTK